MFKKLCYALATIAVFFFCITNLFSGENCSFEAPEGWRANNTRWQGDCKDGRAEGLSVLKEYEGNKVKRFFFGQLKAGKLDQGVIDDGEGYQAGRFKDGKSQATSERQIFIDSFKLAEEAAQKVADQYEKSGNPASAVFYKDKARQLQQQMD